MEIEVQGQTYALNLSNVESKFVEQAISSFIAGDVNEFLATTGDPSTGLMLVLDNASALKERDIYERCLYQAWIDAKVNSGSEDHADLQALFDCADVAKLQLLGEPVGTESVTAYRSVSGAKPYEKLKGICWSESLDVACSFASQLEGPAVYAARLAPEEIFFITNERGEREVVGRPGSIERLKLTGSEIDRRAKRHAPHANGDGRSAS